MLNGKSFNDNQRDFIELMESKYIIAGPGVGKTTCLAAKIVLLLMKLASENSKDTICIITQTNVAVDEINRILRRLGLSQINHPHFVGTVHQFFNTFLAIPYIKKHLNPISLRFADEEDYSSVISGLVHKSSYFGGWSSGPKEAVIRIIKRCNLVYDKDSHKIVLENTPNWSRFENHSTHMFNIMWELKRLGYFTFNDTFLFAEAAMGNKRTISLLRKRFKYLFIDEFQDTQLSSLSILKEIYAVDTNIMQVVGDPNQTLDFDGEMPVLEDNIFELNVCNRFGIELASHLPNIIKGIKVECIKENKSYNPILIIYKKKEQLLPHYKKIVLSHLKKDETFSQNTKKDSILSIRKVAINAYELEEKRQESGYRIKMNESYTTHIIKLVYDLLFQRLSYGETIGYDVKKWIREHPKQDSLKKSLLKSIKSGQLNVASLKDNINSILKEKDSELVSSANSLFKKIASIINIINSPSQVKTKEPDNFSPEFSSIHSAKGETHRSVLLIDSDDSDRIHTKMLKSFYCLDGANYENQWVARNLLYVAMSRPTHLFAFGMDHNLVNQNEIQIFKNKGWTIEFAYDGLEETDPVFDIM